LQTPWKAGTLQDLARTCLTLARQGLDRQQSRRCQERSESYFLDGLDDLIDGGETLAEKLLQNWQGSRQDKLNALIGHCGFFDVASNRFDESCANAQFKPEN
jgi:glutamate--cysteine ligase